MTYFDYANIKPVDDLEAAWFPPDKTVAKSRPGIFKIEVQMPLLRDALFIYTFWVWLDGRAHRVEIRLMDYRDVLEAGASALEHWFQLYAGREARKSLQNR